MNKSMTETRSMKIYNLILNELTDEKVLGNGITYGNELNKIGVKLLKKKFKGVFPSDKIPRLSEYKKYAILNLDKSNEAGSHWIAIAYDDKNVYVYDSFGRKSSKIIPSLKLSGNGRVREGSDYDAEQKIREDNCGGRSMAWLLFFDRYGVENAMKI